MNHYGTGLNGSYKRVPTVHTAQRAVGRGLERVYRFIFPLMCTEQVNLSMIRFSKIWNISEICFVLVYVVGPAGSQLDQPDHVSEAQQSSTARAPWDQTWGNLTKPDNVRWYLVINLYWNDWNAIFEHSFSLNTSIISVPDWVQARPNWSRN